jgi:hypothetical protein
MFELRCSEFELGCSESAGTPAQQRSWAVNERSGVSNDNGAPVYGILRRKDKTRKDNSPPDRAAF